MDGSPDDDAEPTAVERVDRRQLLLVASCLLAVFVAALLAPPPVDAGISVDPPREDEPEPTPQAGSSGGGGGGGGGGSGGGSNSGGGGGGDGDSGGGESGDSNVVGGEGAPVPIPGGDAPPTADGCGVLLEDEPIPGTTVTVGVFEDRVPVSDVRVRFDGDPVGRTDENGRVTGRVPYNRTLSVTVDMATDCEFYRERWESTGGREQAAIRPARDGETAVRPTGEAGSATRRALLAGVLPGGQRHSQADQSGKAAGANTTGENTTGEYGVRGDVDLSVRGEPYPGSSLTLTASVEDVPMRQATVSIEGSDVGRTNASGLAKVTTPDGRQSVNVTVRRGDFAGETTVDVLLLTATVQPREGFPFPGEPAVVNASLDQNPAGDVSVSVAGQRVGTTAADGSLDFALPAVPVGEVAAVTERQSTSISLWSVYAPTLVNVLVVCWLGVAAVWATRPWRGTGSTPRVALAWGGVAVADAALIVGELPGLGLALLGMGSVGLVHYRRRVRSGGERAAGTAVSAVQIVRRVALEITVALERLVDRVRDLLGRLWARMTSFETFVAWVGAAVRKVLVTVWVYMTLRRVGFALLAVAELAVANARWGDEGLVASVAGLSILAVLVAVWRYVRSDTSPAVAADDETGRTGSVRTRQATEGTDDPEERVVSIRELWRTFARWVVPGAWRTQTPGEVARAAVDRGFPREPVEALTDAFRDVEYGSEPATTRRERAKAAFDRLARSRGEDDE